MAIPAACLLITLASWVWSRETLIGIRRNIENSQDKILTSNQVLIQNLNAATGVRGYAITRDPEFLAPFSQASVSLESKLDRLVKVQHPAQRQQAQTIKRLSQQNMASLQQIVDAVPVQPQASLTLELESQTASSKLVLDELRSAINLFQQEQQKILNSYIEQRTNVQEATAAALWFTAIISALGSWAAIYLFTKLDKDLFDREQRLKESRSLLNAIIANVVDGVVILDDFGKIENFNPTASVMFGYQPSEVLGHDLDCLFAAPLPQDAAAHLENALLTGYTWQTQGVRRDRSTFPISVSISDVQLDDHRLIAIIRDTTEVQQTQEKLQSRADELARISAILAQTNVALEERNRELEQFAYVASHDLKAPLRAIANLSEWIEEDLGNQLPAENQKQMQLLRGRVHRMEALINGLLEYSRIGRTNADIEVVSVAMLLGEVVDSLAPPATFTIDIAPNMPTLRTKVLLLRQVFANLIGNAIFHHHRPAGQIQIGVTEQDQFYEFSVTDDGPGIHPNYHDKIFTIFQTLQARDVKESTGIGLAIVKKIVEIEGGTIRVESQEGAGATFYFTWRKTG